MREISGNDAETFLHEQISLHCGGITQTLASFDAESAVFAWLDTIRAIEEFINLPLFCVNDDELEQAIFSLRLDPPNPTALAPIRDALIARFGEGIAQRFILTVLQAGAISEAFRLHGFFEAAAGLQTVSHAISYFQSRRRHLVALLYTLPTACCGTHPVTRLDTLNYFLPQVEGSGIVLTGLYQKIMLAKVFADFRLQVHSIGFVANHCYETLDNSFLEPERAGIVEMRTAMANAGIRDQLEPVDPRRIFSAAELRNDIRLIEAAYSEFDLANTAFAPMAQFVRNCLTTCEDDYLIKLPATQFDQLVKGAEMPATMRRHLVHQGADYVANTNVFAPFIDLGCIHISTVTLLSRFIYHWKSKCLNRVPRFQIRSGFLFEDSVKAALTEQGFTMTTVKRINRKEFDVVAVLDGIIYNVQCKNNLVDLSRIEADTTLFARYNRRLDRYYARALAKEEAREQLLKDELGFAKVKHVIVSRFPIATTNPRVIYWGHIDRFETIVRSQQPT